MTDNAHSGRRRFLTISTSFMAGAGTVGATVPFIQSWNPNARATAASAPLRVDISKIETGTMLTASWQGKPIFILRRTPDSIENLSTEQHRSELRDPDSMVNQQPEYTKNEYRSIRPEVFIGIGICTHLGCIPNYEPRGMLDVSHALYFCACHGSKFDLAGRVFENVPASVNLIIPPHQYLSEDIVEIGVDANTVTLDV